MSLQCRPLGNKLSNAGPRCHYCRKRKATTKDHIVPKSKGGQNVAWNYVPACVTCNNKKADTWPTCLCDTCGLSVAIHAEAGIVE